MSLSLSYLKLFELFGFVDSCLSSILGCFSRYFFKYSFCPFVCFFSYWDSYNADVSIPQAPQILFTFLPSFFFLLPKLNTFICPIFTFADSFFYLLRPAVEPFSWISFQLQSFRLVLFYSSYIFYWYSHFVYISSSWFPFLDVHDFLYLFEHI